MVTHGLDTTVAKWMAEASCSEREIMSITVRTTSVSVSKHVRDADQGTQAKGAVLKLESHRGNAK